MSVSRTGVYHMPTDMAINRQIDEMTPAGHMRKVRVVEILFLVAPTGYVSSLAIFIGFNMIHVRVCQHVSIHVE